jgi:FkbM family methyltransferase
MLTDESAVNAQLGRPGLTSHQRWAIVVGYAIQRIRRISPTPIKLAILNLHRPHVGDALCIAKLDGFRIVVSPQDYCGCTLYYHGEYERYQTRAFMGLIREMVPDTFLDVGANIGYYSLMAAAKGVQKVIAFEPSPAISSMFQASIGLNPHLASRIKLIRLAASNQEGEITFWANQNKDNFGLGSVIGGVSKENSQSINVRSTRIDSLLSEIPPGKTLCKIDVEGAEQLALEGMTKTIAERRPAFLIEVHPIELRKLGQSAAGVIEGLLAKAYKLCTVQDGKELSLASGDSLPGENFFVVARPA